MSAQDLAAVVEKALRLKDFLHEEDWLDARDAAYVALEVLVALAAKNEDAA